MKRASLCQLLIFSGLVLAGCQKQPTNPQGSGDVDQAAATTTKPRRAPTTPGKVVAPSVLKSKMQPIGTPAPEPITPPG
jgi:hypothetical protein